MARCIETHIGLFIQGEQHVLVRINHMRGLLVRQKVLGERFLFTWFKEGEIGLVVGEDSSHQLDVGAVFVGKVPIPCLAEVAASPCPLFLSRADVVIGDMEDACLFPMVIVAHKVVVAVVGHIGGGNRNILVA